MEPASVTALWLACAAVGTAFGALLAAAGFRRSGAAGAAAATGAARLTVTASWRLAELDRPTLVARDVACDVPAGATVFASGQVEPDRLSAGCTLRQVPAVAAEFALDAAGAKGLLFLGGVRDGALALVTTDRDLLSRLRAEATTLAPQAEAYVERRRVGELAGRTGVDVETEGHVQDVLPYQGGYLLRLEDGGQVVGVAVAKEPTELKGQRVLVRGRLAKDKNGYPVLQAHDLRRLQ